MGDCYITGSIDIHPPVPADVLAAKVFTDLANDTGVCVRVPVYSDDYSVIECASEDGAYADRIGADIETIVKALGAGYTYTDYLTIRMEDTDDFWRVRVNGSGEVIEDHPEIVFADDERKLLVPGPITAGLTAEDIETALVTLAELWHGENIDNLSARQEEVADVVKGLWTSTHLHDDSDDDNN